MTRILTKTTILTFTTLTLFLGTSEGKITKPADTFSVMAYNVENLFDTIHDEGKDDYTYLPLKVKRGNKEIKKRCESLNNRFYRKLCLELDWSDSVLKQKIMQLSRVIRHVNNGRGPDVLIVEEVENIHVLKMLRDIGLSDLGYLEPVLIEGPDVRGIDIGMLTRYPVVSKKLHLVQLAKRPTRGILEVKLNIEGLTVTLLGNHWPSQANPSSMRLQAAETVHEAIRGSDGPIIITGDFNTLDSDSPNGIEEYLTNPKQHPNFADIEMERYKGKRTSERGTHWYRGKWSSLDRIFINEDSIGKNCTNFPNCLVTDWKDFNIVKEPFMLTNSERFDFKSAEAKHREPIPARFDSRTGKGFSDHLPLTMVFKIIK